MIKSPRFLFSLLVLTVLLTSGIHQCAGAASWTYGFENQSSADGFHLWLIKGKVAFDNWQLPDGWVTNSKTFNYLGGSGPEVAAAEGEWLVTFSDNKPFTLEWAGTLNGVLVDSGRLKYNKDKGWKPSSKFTSAVPDETVPIPGTALLLGFGLVSLWAIKRRIGRDH